MSGKIFRILFKGLNHMINAMELWKPKVFNADSNVEWWNSVAPQFANTPLAEDNFTMGLIKKEQMVKQGGTALDIGCGAGRYALALAGMGAAVTGIDVSPKMIEACKSTDNVSFQVEDWHNLDIDAKGWRKAFDLVLANMTPAIVDGAGFVKMIEASCDWCLLVKPVNRKSSIYNELLAIIGAQDEKAASDDAVEYAFSILWNRGLRPFFSYDRQVWYNSEPLEQAIEKHTKRIGTYFTLNDAQRGLIRDFLVSRAVNGEVEETTNTEIVALYWQVGCE
jgi:SAM-dependent methyltransferase